MVLKELIIMSKEVVQFFPAKNDRASTDSRISSNARPRKSKTKLGIENEIERDIEMLFQQKVQIFGAVDFYKLSILTGIVKICLKTLVECIRLQTFSKNGFQQIQVDAYFVRITFKDYIDDEGLLEHLLDVIINSAAERCLEPASLTQVVIETICGQYISNPPDPTAQPLSPRGTLLSPREPVSPLTSPRGPPPALLNSPRPGVLTSPRAVSLSPRSQSGLSPRSPPISPTPELRKAVQNPTNRVKPPQVPVLVLKQNFPASK